MRSVAKLLFALVLFAGVVTGIRWQRYDEPPAKFWARVRAGHLLADSVPADEEVEQAGADRPAVVAGSAAKHGPPAGGKHILPPGGAETRVLFIGNSLVYSHAMPQMLERLAWSDGINLNADQSTVGGYTLQQHASRDETREMIANGDWDVVVLQEQSRLPSLGRASVDERTFPGAMNLAMAVRSANPGARIHMYVTPAWRDGDPERASQIGEPATSAAMQARLNSAYADIGRRLDAATVQAGAAWQRVLASQPGIDLYDDNVHPSRAGAYLIACVFYKALTGRSPVGNTYTATLDANTARTLQSIAAGTM